MTGRGKALLTALCLLLCAVLTVGCGAGKEDTRIVLTTDFKTREIFRINDVSCYLPETMVYLVNMQDQYEQVYGPEIWKKDLGEGVTFEEKLKDTIIARMAQIKVMTLLAREKDISLNKNETLLVGEAAEKYFATLNESETGKMGVDAETVKQLYADYALANKVYQEITKDINPEISDDEARTISVKHIMVKTYYLDASGNKVDFNESQKREAYGRMVQIKKELSGGADFEEMAEKYNEDSESVYAFGKGTMDPAFEEAAFNLDTGEVSDIVESRYGYHIILCTSTFDREETDANKEKILAKRRNEAFNEEYDAFAATLTSNLNEELWDSVAFVSDSGVTTTSFFDVYNEVFEGGAQE